MKRPEPGRVAAFAAAAALMAAVALWRFDLVAQAWNVTLHQFQLGGMARAKLLFEVVLYGGILTYTLRVVGDRVDPRRDGARVTVAFAAGWAAEAWGTRLGLWRYYTREAPPLWIVPAWPLGTLVIERTAASLRPLLGRLGPDACRLLYVLAAGSAATVCLAFAWPTAPHPATLAAWAGVAAALAWRADSERDLPVLAAGAVCILFADGWGTTNNCWRYWLETRYGSWGLAGGIVFGASFDTAVVLGCLKAAEGLYNLGQRS